MNGNWNGINSRYQDQIHQKVSNMYQDGTEPSMDVINTIIASYAASNCDERDTQHQMSQLNLSEIKASIPMARNDSNRYDANRVDAKRYDANRDDANRYDANRDEANRYARFNEPGCRPEKSSTPVKRFDQQPDSPNHFVHPYVMKLQKQGTIDPEDDAESNAATDQSGNRSEAGDSYRETMTELAHSISVVTKKLHWATAQLEENSSIDGSINAVRLVSECAQTIAHLKRAKLSK